MTDNGCFVVLLLETALLLCGCAVGCVVGFGATTLVYETGTGLCRVYVMSMVVGGCVLLLSLLFVMFNPCYFLYGGWCWGRGRGRGRAVALALALALATGVLILGSIINFGGEPCTSQKGAAYVMGSWWVLLVAVSGAVFIDRKVQSPCPSPSPTTDLCTTVVLK